MMKNNNTPSKPWSTKKKLAVGLGLTVLAAGVAAGGKPIEDPPGWREGAGMRLYLAYLRDPDGNKICALHRG